jgi:hypothetical protein
MLKALTLPTLPAPIMEIISEATSIENAPHLLHRKTPA